LAAIWHPGRIGIDRARFGPDVAKTEGLKSKIASEARQPPEHRDIVVVPEVATAASAASQSPEVHLTPDNGRERSAVSNQLSAPEPHHLCKLITGEKITGGGAGPDNWQPTTVLWSLFFADT
jgi:hypothetical protein